MDLTRFLGEFYIDLFSQIMQNILQKAFNKF